MVFIFVGFAGVWYLMRELSQERVRRHQLEVQRESEHPLVTHHEKDSDTMKVKQGENIQELESKPRIAQLPVQPVHC